MGIAPTYPSVEHGYLQYEPGSEGLDNVIKFIEKPDPYVYNWLSKRAALIEDPVE